MIRFAPSTRIAFPALALGLALLAPALPGQTPPRDGRDLRRTPVVVAAERIGPSVVNVSAEQLVRRRSTLFEDFFSLNPVPRERRTESLGSGVVLDERGIVVTNDHVVSGASRITVTTADRRELEAEVLGADADNDLAVLKVKGQGLRAVALGSSADLMIGEPAIAVGNPFGLSNTVTVGIVSALQRSVQGEARTYSDFIQTDAAINPGNSGGALANILGQLIGINTAIVGGANTIGFAIPVDRVKRIADDLLRFGEVKPVWLGLRGKTLGSDRDRPSARGRGLRIRSVYPDSPADRAGLAPGDVVVAFNGRPVESREDFETQLASLGPDKPASLVVVREGKETTVATRTQTPPDALGLEVLRRDVGISLGRGRSLSVSAVAHGSPADEKGIERGDRILAVNGRRVESLEELEKEVVRGFSRSALLLVVARGRYAYNLTFGLD